MYVALGVVQPAAQSSLHDAVAHALLPILVRLLLLVHDHHPLGRPARVA